MAEKCVQRARAHLMNDMGRLYLVHEGFELSSSLPIGYNKEEVIQNFNFQSYLKKYSMFIRTIRTQDELKVSVSTAAKDLTMERKGGGGTHNKAKENGRLGSSTSDISFSEKSSCLSRALLYKVALQLHGQYRNEF